MRYLSIIAVLFVLPLAACDDGKPGTSVSIDVAGDDGNVVGGIDGNTGQATINVPGFSGKVTLPKLKLDAGDFDMNGVHLYPGSTISSMKIVAKDGKDGGEDRGTVRVAFESPADAATVRDWFAERLNKANFTVTARGNSVIGTDPEKHPFRLDLTPDGDGRAKGVILTGN